MDLSTQMAVTVGSSSSEASSMQWQLIAQLIVQLRAWVHTVNVGGTEVSNGQNSKFYCNNWCMC